MATKQIYLVNEREPYYRTYATEYKTFNGFSIAQKRRSVESLHNAYLQIHREKKILEVSSASMDELGVKLSAFNLLKHVPSLDRSIPLERIFQGGKVYENGGPYLDMYDMPSNKAKNDERKNNSGKLIAFEFEGRRFPLEPKTMFYDYLYLSALRENPELANQLLQYDGFTDIFFNPEKQFNCQAISCAKYVSLVKLGKLEEYLNQIEETIK